MAEYNTKAEELLSKANESFQRADNLKGDAENLKNEYQLYYNMFIAGERTLSGKEIIPEFNNRTIERVLQKGEIKKIAEDTFNLKKKSGLIIRIKSILRLK